MGRISIIMMGVALFLYPVWLLLSVIFERNSIYPSKRDWIIMTLGIMVFLCCTVSVIISLVF